MSYPTIIRPSTYRNKETDSLFPSDFVSEETYTFPITGAYSTSIAGRVIRLTKRLYLLYFSSINVGSFTANDNLYINLPTSVFKKNGVNLVNQPMNLPAHGNVNGAVGDLTMGVDTISSDPKLFIKPYLTSFTIGQSFSIFDQQVLLLIDDY